MVKKTSPTVLNRVRDNPWIVVTLVLGIVLVITLFMKGAGVTSASMVSEDEASQNVLDFLNSQVQDGEVELDSVTQENGMYKVTVNYNGQTIPLYVTLDGTHVASDLIALDGSGTPTTGTGTTVPAERVTVETGTAPALGPATAPVTVVEFSDFQCPFCERAYSDAVKQIKDQYIATGKVRFVYMNYPLSFHPEAMPAARAALCFREVKGGSDTEYFKYHDKLFENQATLSETNYKKWARELGATGSRFDTCFDSDKYTDEINAEMNYGSSLGVTGTPGFFINGIMLEGAQPFSAFKQIIDAELGAAA